MSPVQKVFLSLLLTCPVIAMAVAQDAPISVANYKIGMSFEEFSPNLNDLTKRVCSSSKINLQGVSCVVIPPKDKEYAFSELNFGGISVVIYGIRIERAVGISARFVFHEEKLVLIEVFDPTVNVDVLQTKYGKPVSNDSTAIVVCQNRLGMKFDEKTGFFERSWRNEKTHAMLIEEFTPHGELLGKCGGSFKFTKYVLFDASFRKLVAGEIDRNVEKNKLEKVKSSAY